MQTINKLGMKFLKNNSWGGTCVAGSSNSATSSDVRLKEIMLGKQAPDVLIIFMGANDCGSKFAINTFDSAYKLMLDKIKVLCPNTEIYLMTLPSTGLYEDSAKEEFSEVIRKYAKEYNYGLIDIAALYTKSEYKNYVLDSAHPNLEGMTMFAETAVKAMLEFKGISVPTE